MNTKIQKQNKYNTQKLLSNYYKTPFEKCRQKR